MAKIQRPRFLPFLTVWLLAVAVLAGLVYWGDSSRSTTPKGQTKVAASVRGSQKRPSRPSKPPEARKSPSPSNPDPAPPGWIPFPSGRSQHGSDPPVKPSAPEPSSPAKAGGKIAIALSSPSPPPPTTPPPAPPGPTLTTPVARVAIVIDDFGRDLEIAEKFLALPFPVTLSVLPHLHHSREVANMAHKQGHEVMLHMPMQPIGYPKTDPGKGALLLSMSRGQITEALEAAIASCPHLAGFNNHMGSRFTADPSLMEIVINEASRRNLFFLDSHTSPRSVGYSVAQELHVPSLKRDVFLDNTETEDAIRSQLALLIKKARVQGSAVAIGHPYESTCRVLNQAASLFRDEGIAVVPAGELVKGR